MREVLTKQKVKALFKHVLDETLQTYPEVDSDPKPQLEPVLEEVRRCNQQLVAEIKTELSSISSQVERLNHTISDTNRGAIPMNYAAAVAGSNPVVYPVQEVFSLTILMARTSRMTDGEFQEAFCKIRQLLEVRKSNIRVIRVRQNAKGNLILHFPTREDKEKAKAKLEPAYNRKITDPEYRKISLAIKHIRKCELKDLEEELRIFNVELKDEEFELQWIGKHEFRKALKLTVNKKTAARLLDVGHLLTEMESHPVQVWIPAPFRCMKCMTFHGTRAEHCRGERHCRYCSSNLHTQDLCPNRDQPENHRCAACITRGISDHHHEAFHRGCPVFLQEQKRATEDLIAFVRGAHRGVGGRYTVN